MTDIATNLKNRAWLLERLRAEVVGPDPAGKPVNIGTQRTMAWPEGKSFWEPKKQSSGEELLWRDGPVNRYGAGVLFPGRTPDEDKYEAELAELDGPDSFTRGDEVTKVDEELEKKAQCHYEADGGDEEVSLANAWRPAAMGLSFLAPADGQDCTVRVEIGDFRKQPDGKVSVVPCATYRPIDVSLGDAERTDQQRKRRMWARVPVLDERGDLPTFDFSLSHLIRARVTRQPVQAPNLDLTLVVVIRELKWEGYENYRLITISLVNNTINTHGVFDELCLFQSGLRVSSPDNRSWISPYPMNPPEALAELQPEDETLMAELMYREWQTFAIGHGCAAEWPGEKPKQVSEIWSETLPIFETPSTSADLKDEEGRPLRISMRKLAGLDPEEDGYGELRHLVDSYERWIRILRERLSGSGDVPERLTPTAKILLERCEVCLARLRRGLAFLETDGRLAQNAREAFCLANKAMLLSQLRASRETRRAVDRDGRLEWLTQRTPTPRPEEPHATKGYWRAFQIAFLLMTLPGICDPADANRETVDLIWFPTGGGKTEAYLGLTAFTIFFNRLEQRVSGGADVLMRYTLRLLTAQQFERAGLLFCAMEHLRLETDNVGRLGDKEFSLGMWVGGDASPNRRQDAVIRLKKLAKNPKTEENPFVLLKCPWCSAEFGPRKETSGRGSKKVLGYSRELGPDRKQTVRFRCEDTSCEYHDRPLPIYVIDEDIYENPPSLVIGTVDKFALLPWKPEVRSLFGVTAGGEHKDLPPSLIIQDELHLISGPLGSVAGAFETIIEELCTLRRDDCPIRPKIIASTATISRSQEQVRSLYGRERVSLFPPSGLEAGESFFATITRRENGELAPGRLYVGVMGSAYTSQQTAQARIYANLLQWPLLMEHATPEQIDPWWTLLGFYNSLRELGGALTLMVSDVRDYLRVIINRHGMDYSKIRQLLNVEELTSRIRSDEVPLAIQKLEKHYDGNNFSAIEACLASNIIEVGVDIDRLALMCVVGQPKTTSQYIQVTSRVGRSHTAPGLVCVIFSPGKPRDRSHFEHFRSFHQQLYAQVEPTSVTPFSPPAVDRVLHAIIVAMARQLQSIKEAETPRPFPFEKDGALRIRLEELIVSRVQTVDSSEEVQVRKMLDRRLREWRAWNPSEYGGFGAPPDNAPLIHPAGSVEPPGWYGHSWPTMISMRNVDAGCEAEITLRYNTDDSGI